jgi:hypothetical protein
MFFYAVIFKIIRYFMGQPGKVKSDGNGGLYKPGCGAAYLGYLKSIHYFFISAFSRLL